MVPLFISRSLNPVFTLVIVLVLNIQLFSQVPTDLDLKSQFDEMLTKQYGGQQPGATVLVARYGDVIYRNAFGMADLELNVPMKPDMIFEVGSLTKQFTAISILILVENGQLNLDDDIRKFIPDYPTRGFTITIHDLLTHTSGISSYTNLEGWETKLDYEPKEFIDFFKDQPLDFAPGEKYEYNNSSYYILGYIIEKVSGYSYPEFLEINIIKSVGLSNTYYSTKKRTIKNRAHGFQKYGNEYINTGYATFTPPYAAGSLMTNVDDLFKWHVALHSGRLIEKGTLDRAFREYKLNDEDDIYYGYGWALKHINDSPTYEHPGGIWGYSVNQIYLPEEDVFVAVFSNCDCNPPVDISTRMAAIAINKPYEWQAIELEDKELMKFTGVYQFEDGTVRSISFEEGQLYSQRSGQPRYKMYPYEDSKFFFEDSFTTLEFVGITGRFSKGVVTRNRNTWEYSQRNDNLLKEEVYVDESVLKKYVGIYKLDESLYVTVTLENGKLMTQATGQQKFQVFPESEIEFFFKVVYAQIEFILMKDDVTGLILTNAGSKLQATKIE
jgi:CubicO group peptidase (beta-lactamase class C family)